jgi:hypothetical protein
LRTAFRVGNGGASISLLDQFSHQRCRDIGKAKLCLFSRGQLCDELRAKVLETASRVPKSLLEVINGVDRYRGAFVCESSADRAGSKKANVMRFQLIAAIG